MKNSTEQVRCVIGDLKNGKLSTGLAHELDRNADDLNVVIRSLSQRIRPVTTLRVVAGTVVRDITRQCALNDNLSLSIVYLNDALQFSFTTL